MSPVRHSSQNWRSHARRWILGTILVFISLGVLFGVYSAGQQISGRQASFSSLRESVAEPNVSAYATSDRCQTCHPAEYQSWSETYHSTMTQLPSPDTVLGNFDNHSTIVGEDHYRFYRRGEEYWVELPEHWAEKAARYLDSEAPPRDQRIVLMTGSHHQQVYWVEVKGRILATGVNWIKEFNQFVPLNDIFLRPTQTTETRSLQEWTTNCIRCHSTPAWRTHPTKGPGTKSTRHPVAAKKGLAALRQMPSLSLAEPDLDPGLRSLPPSPAQMPELGISCEACHGPGEAHIELYSSPLRRYAQHLDLLDDDHQILNPKAMSGHEASLLCGSCHAPRSGFRVGDGSFRRKTALENPSLIWPDGMIRSGGRGYIAIQSSPCFADEDFGCTSCHSMHDSSPSDQLAAGLEANQDCLQCHSGLAEKVEEHTRHAPESSGSLCYDCHMPHTSFNLLKATRSHEISSPNAAVTRDTGRPNACNLCHLDRSLGWTAEMLTRWYGQPRVDLDDDQRNLSAAALGALKGDAMVRALYGWSMGQQRPQDISGRNWLVPFLAVLLNDPYSAVRVVANRSIRSIPGWENYEHDPWLPPLEEQTLHDSIARQWPRAGRFPERVGSDVLLGPDGVPEWETFEALLSVRDLSAVQISE